MFTRLLAAALVVLAYCHAQQHRPAIDYAVPLARQPFAQDPNVIWYDSFDDASRRSQYFEFVTADGLFDYTDEEALGGRGQSLKGLFRKGTVSAGSLKVNFGDCPMRRNVVRGRETFNQVYWRIYVKHQRGWTGNPAKLSRATSFASSQWAQSMIAHVWGGPGNVLTLDPARGIDASGNLATTRYNDFAHLRWLGNRPAAGYPIFATEESGKWVAVEAEATLNTPGRADGTFTLWIDTRMEAFREHLDWTGAWREKGINAVFLENYWNQGSPVEQARYFDDFVISTRPIGLARTSRNPELGKTACADAEQTAFQMQVADARTGEIVWESNVVAGQGTRATVDKRMGVFRGTLAAASMLAPGTVYQARVRERTATAWSEWSAWRAVIHTVVEP